MSSQPKTFLTPQEYLEIERKAEYKSEYYAGEMFAMSGGTANHSFIGCNIIALLTAKLRGSSCRAANSDLRVSVTPHGPFYYPDAMILCGEIKFADNRQDVVTNPVVIFEVLSPSTATYDLGRSSCSTSGSIPCGNTWLSTRTRYWSSGLSGGKTGSGWRLFTMGSREW